MEGRSRCDRDRPTSLIRFSPLLLAQSLPRKRFFRPALLAGLHVEAVLLDFLDDVFLLHLALKPAQSVLQRFAFLDDDFSHFILHPQSGLDWFFVPAGCTAAGAMSGILLDTAPGHYRMSNAARSHPPRSQRLNRCTIREHLRRGSWHSSNQSHRASQAIFQGGAFLAPAAGIWQGGTNILCQ